MEKAKSGIVLKKTSAEIAKFKAVNGPGTYQLHAGSSNWVEQEGLPEGKYIVGIKAVAKHKQEEFFAAFNADGDAEIEAISACQMTANIPVNRGNANIPMKNQLVKVQVDYVEARDVSKVLAIVAIEVPKAMKGASLFAPAEEAEATSTNRISATDATSNFEAQVKEKDKVKA
jgi:hypothetical protein